MNLSLAELVQLKRAKEQADSAASRVAVRYERSLEAFRIYGARNLGKGRTKRDGRQFHLRLVVNDEA